jgi:hypothetical protein
MEEGHFEIDQLAGHAEHDLRECTVTPPESFGDAAGKDYGELRHRENEPSE